MDRLLFQGHWWRLDDVDEHRPDSLIMAIYPRITEEQAALIRAARVFFVASASPDLSLGPENAGPVNLSPKGGTLHIIDTHRVAYLDRKGSGHETARHAASGGPITVMVMSMNDEDAAVVRLFGRASVCAVAESPLKDLFRAEMEDVALPSREVVEVAVERTQTSCGYGVPVFEFISHRTRTQRGRRFKRSWISLFVTIAALLGSASPAVAQAPASRPAFSGTWAPSDPERSDKLFDVGLTTIPGRGRLTIEQRPDRLTVTIAMPDDKLDPLLTISGRFYPTVIYRLTEAQGRPGGFGASGPLPPSRPAWYGEQLVIPDAWPSTRRTTTTYSLDGERLKLDTRVEIGPGRENTVTEWFIRVK